MPAADAIKPTHKAIERYYQTLAELSAQRVEHEMAVRSAFQNLLADTARARGWVFIPELSKHSATLGRARVRPDGTVRDENTIARGYWEAKDSGDSLDAEIAKKKSKGYPLNNIIFEDTREAVLYQNKNEALRVDLREPQKLADLLNEFYRHTEPEIERFDQAVEEFKTRIPELAKGLEELIAASHSNNRKFEEAFVEFFTLCQSSLNPNISRAAVDEMLVQHLLTERLFRTIFNKPEFTRQNAIAAEVEKVIDALTSKAFNRTQFLQGLNAFYRAIEDAALTMSDFSEKQHFLNTVYERFFQGYSVRTADTHGIVYTPQPIVDFMCASVSEVLEKEFGLTLGSPGVNILDPCTGTGNFIVNLMRRIPKKDLKRVYKEQLFANEIMLLPYYIAALNIEHAYYELTGEYEPFEGLCFVDTLDMAEHQQGSFSFMTESNTIRVERQKMSPITVIIGNPPYNMGQKDENENNQNRKYDTIDQRINATYAKDSKATLRNKLYDMYVKFFRWSVDRLLPRDGIVCFVSNNSFVDQIAFDGMRKRLMEDFTRIYHVDLHGNVRQNPKLSGTTHNVFGIQIGVGITIAARVKKKHKETTLQYYRVPEFWRKEEKLLWLSQMQVISGIAWQSLLPDSRNDWIVPENAREFESFFAVGTQRAKASKGRGSIDVIFTLYSLGIATNRDAYVYSFDLESLKNRVKLFIDIYTSALDRAKRLKEKGDLQKLADVNDFRIKWTRQVKASLESLKESSFEKDSLRNGIYRPFTKTFVYFNDFWNEERYKQHLIFPKKSMEMENAVVCFCSIGGVKDFHCLVANVLPDLHFTGDSQCFPFYTYDEDGSNRRENITDWALEKFRKQYKNPAISKWDIFYYVYGMLHHTGYIEKFADNLKRELPRIPFAGGGYRAFQQFADAGKKLAELHLDYEKLDPYPLKWIETKGVPLSYRVEKMRLNKEKTALQVNASLTLAGIPAAVFEYRLGNRSALDWVIDQYQVLEDKRSGIRSDPNRADDPEYIVRLVGQVVQVSLETVKLVQGLPTDYA